MHKSLIASYSRSVIQAILLLGIHKAFSANSNYLKSDCAECGHVFMWFDIISDVFFVFGIVSLLPPLFLAVATWQRALDAPMNSVAPSSAVDEKVGHIQRFNNLTSWTFFFVLSIGIVVTDGILESALAGLLTVSLLYSIWRIQAHSGGECWRAMEVLTVLIVITVGELALNYGFGATVEFRNAARMFDSSIPTKLLGYCTFSVGFGVVIWENASNLKAAWRGFCD